MAKKKSSSKKQSQWKPIGFGTDSLANQVKSVEKLLHRGHIEKGLDLLESLNQRYPGQEKVLILLSEIYFELQDLSSFQHVCEQLYHLNPENPDYLLNLTTATIRMTCPFLTLKMGRLFLEKWPDDSSAETLRSSLNDIENNLDELLAEIGIQGLDNAHEIAADHEQVGLYFERRDFARCKALAIDLLERHPGFSAVTNNLSQIYFWEGDLQGAIALAQGLLETHPNNVHALANLVRYTLFQGDSEAARGYAERLKAVDKRGTILWAKQAEALSYLGDDAGVLETYQEAKANGDSEHSDGPLLYHLAAVASLRLGHLSQARQLWRQALEVAPGFSIAADNLAELDRPLRERNGAWPFELSNWLLTQWAKEIVSLVLEDSDNDEGDGDDGQKNELLLQSYLQERPGFEGIINLLLERGDPIGREFAVRTALTAKTPSLVASLTSFIRRPWGTDALRHQTLLDLKRAKLISGDMKIWLNGEEQDILPLGFELSYEPTVAHNPQVLKLMEKAIPLLHQQTRDGAIAAEKYLNQALEVEPNSPHILNNLSLSYLLQERKEDAENLILHVAEQFPDYVFGQVSLAKLNIQAGKIEEAENILKPLLRRDEFHVSEFAALADTYILCLVLLDNIEGALSWLQMWKQTMPDHPEIRNWEKKFKEFQAIEQRMK